MIRDPQIIANDSGRHQIWLCWSDDDEHPAHAIIWRTRDGEIVLKGIVANRDFRGRDMLRWIASAWGLPIRVVEVIPSAMGFWERMMRDGVIIDWEPSDGFASRLERRAVPMGTRIAA